MYVKHALRHVFIVLIAILSAGANAQPQLTCHLDWSELANISGPDPTVMIYGVKAGDWTREHVDLMLAKQVECLATSTDPDTVKNAVAQAVETQLYPNALEAIQLRDQRLADEQARLVKEQQEQVQAVAAAVAEAPPVEQESVQQEQPAIAAVQADVVPTQPALVQKAEGDRFLVTVLAVLAALVGAWLWNRFVRNRCPSCKAGSPEREETEIDRWRGTKQVSEKNSRGTNTRHVQTTYVKMQFDYQCKHCQEEWSKQRKEELGNHSGVGRFFSGY